MIELGSFLGLLCVYEAASHRGTTGNKSPGTLGRASAHIKRKQNWGINRARRDRQGWWEYYRACRKLGA